MHIQEPEPLQVRLEVNSSAGRMGSDGQFYGTSYFFTRITPIGHLGSSASRKMRESRLKFVFTSPPNSIPLPPYAGLEPLPSELWLKSLIKREYLFCLPCYYL